MTRLRELLGGSRFVETAVSKLRATCLCQLLDSGRFVYTAGGSGRFVYTAGGGGRFVCTAGGGGRFVCTAGGGERARACHIRQQMVGGGRAAAVLV